MPRKNTAPTGDLVFEDETTIPNNVGRKTNVPDSLLNAVRTLDPKSIVVGNEDEAKAFRALVRSAAGLLERREDAPYGAQTAQETLPDGRVKVYFRGRMKASDE